MNKSKTLMVASLSMAAAVAASACMGASEKNGPAKTAKPEAGKTYSYDVSDPCYYSSACYSVEVGSSEVDSSKLAPYHAQWTQSARGEDGALTLSPGRFQEILTKADDGAWRHVQNIIQEGELMSAGIRRMDGDTLQILDVTLDLRAGPPQQPAKVFYDLRGNEFAAQVTMKDGAERTGASKSLALPMFDGQIAGVVIAALPLKEGYTATLPAVIPNLGIYWMEVSVIGGKEITSPQGEAIATWEVYANWLNLSDGDIYKPGPDQSGGAYYIALEPGAGVPPVVEYANDGAVISWDGVRRTVDDSQ